jgi:hypothetical protein
VFEQNVASLTQPGVGLSSNAPSRPRASGLAARGDHSELVFNVAKEYEEHTEVLSALAGEPRFDTSRDICPQVPGFFKDVQDPGFALLGVLGEHGRFYPSATGSGVIHGRFDSCDKRLDSGDRQAALSAARDVFPAVGFHIECPPRRTEA